jgi:hypothetical protein
MAMNFEAIAGDLLETVSSSQTLLLQIGNADAAPRPLQGKWSKKEILAHLIDSASNNHQRFVRAASQGSLDFPGYDQAEMVALQKPNLASWELLIELWSAYNRYLAHVLNQLPDSCSEMQCKIGAHAPVTLLSLAADYVEHLKHHLNQIVGSRFPTAWSATA